MPLRELHLLREPIVECLRTGERPSWEIEETLAQQFNLTRAERALMHERSGTAVWTNDVAWGLSRLVQEEVIRGFKKQWSPDGKMRGVYRLLSQG